MSRPGQGNPAQPALGFELGGCFDRPAVDNEATFARGDRNCFAVGNAVLENHVRERVLQLALDDPFQRARAVGRVVARIGKPGARRVVELDTRSAYEYRFTKQSSAGLWLIVVGFLNEDTRSDRVWVFFDAKGVLTHFGATFEAHRAHPAMPWRDIHDPEKNAKRDAKWDEKQSKR